MKRHISEGIGSRHDGCGPVPLLDRPLVLQFLQCSRLNTCTGSASSVSVQMDLNKGKCLLSKISEIFEA